MIRLEHYKRAWREYVARGQQGPFPIQSPFAEQRPATFYPGLNSRLVHDRSLFPWIHELEAACPMITSELDQLLSQRSGFLQVYQDYTDQGQWAGCYFYIFGQPVESNCEICPETARILKSIPGVAQCGTSLFSVLAPGTRVTPHCGNTNAKLRCQLPLRVPEKCGLRVADHPIEQEEGCGFVFDDSFMHMAWNESNKPRFVLLFDLDHPELTRAERAFLRSIALETHPETYYWDFIREGQPATWVYQ